MLYPFNLSRLSDPKASLATGDERELESFQLGVWMVSILKSSPLNLRKQFLDLKDALRYFQRLATDVYTLEPMLMTLFVLNELWSGIQGALLLHLSSQILRMVRVSSSMFYIELTPSRKGRNRFGPRVPRDWRHSQGPRHADSRCYICSTTALGEVNSTLFSYVCC